MTTERETNGTNTKRLKDAGNEQAARSKEASPSSACQDCDGDCGVCDASRSRIQKEEKKLKGNMNQKMEQRVNVAGFEIREESDGMHFAGYAALFDSPSQPLPFTERHKVLVEPRLRRNTRIYPRSHHDAERGRSWTKGRRYAA